jgi:hypothetical protein
MSCAEAGKTSGPKKTPQSGVFLWLSRSKPGKMQDLLGSRCVGSRCCCWSSRSVSSRGWSSHRSWSGWSSSFFFFTASGQSSSSDDGGQNEGLVHDDFPLRGLKTISGNCRRLIQESLNRDKSTRVLLHSVKYYIVFPNHSGNKDIKLTRNLQ